MDGDLDDNHQYMKTLCVMTIFCNMCCFLQMLASTDGAAPMPQLTALLDEKELRSCSGS